MSEPAPAVLDLARASLDDVASAGGVGEVLSVDDRGEGVTDVAFESALPGYIGWRWSVSVAQLEDAAPTVLEVGLVPGNGALVAPAWVPWADRLAEYRRLHPDEPIDDATDEDGDADDDLDDADSEDDDLDDADDADDDLDEADELDGVDFEADPEDGDEGRDEDEDDGDGDEDG